MHFIPYRTHPYGKGSNRHAVLSLALCSLRNTSTPSITGLGRSHLEAHTQLGLLPLRSDLAYQNIIKDDDVIVVVQFLQPVFYFNEPANDRLQSALDALALLRVHHEIITLLQLFVEL